MTNTHPFVSNCVLSLPLLSLTGMLLPSLLFLWRFFFSVNLWFESHAGAMSVVLGIHCERRFPISLGVGCRNLHGSDRRQPTRDWAGLL